MLTTETEVASEISQIRFIEEPHRQKALKQLEPLLEFLYPREDAKVKREIAGTLLWRLGKAEPFKRTDGKFLCQKYSFNENTYQIVKAELEDSGVVKYDHGVYRKSFDGLKKILNCLIDYLSVC